MSLNRNRSRITTCLLLFFFFICLLMITVIIGTNLVTSQAEQIFGPPSPQLGTIQRYYLSAVILFQYTDLTLPTNPDGSETSLTIQPGESVPSIVGKLWEAGLISNPDLFRNYLLYSGLDTSLKAGKYRLSPALSPIEIAEAIQSSISADVTLTILAGWRVEEIAFSLPSTGLTITPEEFLQSTKKRLEGYSFSECLDNRSLEGFLFPGSYTLSRETKIEQLLPLILMNFETQVTTELKSGFSTQGLNLCQAITLASIVQREAVLEEEMPQIASVFYNRLNSGIPLESDPTVQYAVGFNQNQDTWWTNPLSFNDLQVNSPFNTYVFNGLPPGPICNPGITSLQSVAFPAQTPYFYFRSACDGSGRHVFAETFNEHVANACP